MYYRSPFVLLILIVIGSFAVMAQDTPEVISFEQLQHRYQNNNDTTYVVNFWATWCKPCVKELPYFEKVGAKYEEEGVKVLLVSMDFKSNLEDRVVPFIEDNNIQSEVVLLPQKGANEWIEKVSSEWSGAIPATLIVNQHRDIRKFYEKQFTFEELDSIMQNILQS